jgi:hypothetical protein
MRATHWDYYSRMIFLDTIGDWHVPKIVLLSLFILIFGAGEAYNMSSLSGSLIAARGRESPRGARFL